MSLLEIVGQLGGLESLLTFLGLALMMLLVDRFFLGKSMEE